MNTTLDLHVGDLAQSTDGAVRVIRLDGDLAYCETLEAMPKKWIVCHRDALWWPFRPS